jgi:hypothetical protein
VWLIAVAIGLGAFPVVSFAQAPAGDSAVGTLIDPTGQAGRIDATSGASGENASGTARFGHVEGGLTPLWELEVTCLSVTGQTAVIGFTGTYMTFFGFGETYPTAGLIRAVDGGGPASGQDTAEFASVTGELDGPPIPGPTNCSTYPGGYPGLHGPIVNSEGDLVVTDAQALTTSRDQCKNGGWRRYGTFQNQGECVRFVRAKARQRCVFERVAHGVAAFRARYGTGVPKQHAMRNCVLLGMLG